MNNRNSLAQKFNDNINKCDICFCSYNRKEKQPVIICSMHHTVCRQCLKSLESTRKCPFCREFINFSKTVVNNYIFQLLPNDPLPPNSRVQVSRPINHSLPIQQIRTQNLQQQFYQPFQQPFEPQRIQPQQPLFVQQNFQRNINYNQPIYPEPVPAPNLGYRPLPHHELGQRHQGIAERQCTDTIRRQLRLGETDRKIMYGIFFIMQPLLLIFDLYFSLTGSDPQCYDTSYEDNGYVLRPWLVAMAITQGSIISFISFCAAFKMGGIISFECLQKCQTVASILFGIKIIFWTFMQLALYQYIIQPHCSGGIYVYGLIQSIYHGIIAFIIILLGSTRS